MYDPRIKKIAEFMIEDEDPLSDFHDKWASKTVLGDDTYFKVIGVLKSICKFNGCILDHSKLSVDFIPPGFVIKNVYIDCPDPAKKKELINRLAKQTGDNTIKYKFDENLRVNLYNTMNKEFADKVREELDLDVSHQFMALPPGSKRARRVEVLPMITITTPKVEVEGEEFPEEMMGPEMPDMGMEMGPEAPMGVEADLAAPGQLPLPELGPEFGSEEDEEPLGPGVPMEPGEEELPPREEELITTEDINFIANFIDELL